ncbi:MAG TPA: hypothetical protein VMT88_08370 [Actinomycetes bacterium]|nr:hypothetical protein [Actinomycetes bacterium]
MSLVTTRVRSWSTTIDRRLLMPGSAHRLACMRVALSVAIVFRLAGHQWWQMAGRPPELFEPVAIAAWLSTVPPVGVLVAIEVIGVAAGIAVWFGRWQLWGLRIAWLCLLILGALYSSAGKIMHNEVMLLLVTIPVLVAAPGARVGDRRLSVAYGWAPRAAVAIVASVYFFTGFQKVIHSGPAWVFSDNMSWVLYSGAASGQSLAPTLTATIAGLAWVPSLLAGGALLLELSAPALIGWRVTRPLFIAAVCGMHLSIGVALGLDYSGWILAVVAVLLPWDSFGQGTSDDAQTTRFLPSRFAR